MRCAGTLGFLGTRGHGRDGGGADSTDLWVREVQTGKGPRLSSRLEGAYSEDPAQELFLALHSENQTCYLGLESG